MLKKLTILRDRVADWGSYPFSIPVIHCLEELIFRSRICFFAGETAPVQIVRQFVNDRDGFLEELLKETPSLFKEDDAG
jgi:hypothetical protein